jgi:hypothetical protein
MNKLRKKEQQPVDQMRKAGRKPDESRGRKAMGLKSEYNTG